MKKTLVAQTVAALIGGAAMMGVANAYVVGPAGAPPVNTVPAATTMIVNPQGVGHILLVPYYSAANGNDTYINIVNTDMRNGKAVKVRFRGASNSDDVLDFTVFLSPGDHWSATVTGRDAAGNTLPKPILKTGDKSCTQPAIPTAGVPFIVDRLHPALSAEQMADETREGYVEIFNMADIPPTVATTGTLYRDIEHVSGVPRASNNAATNPVCSSPRLDALLDTTTNPITSSYATAQALGFEVPTSGLMGNTAIVNVPAATTWSGPAMAVEARVGTSATAGYGNIVFHPQVPSPALTLTEARQRTSDPLLRGGAATNTGAEVPGATPAVAGAPYDLPDMSTPYLNSMLDGGFGGPGELSSGASTKRQTVLLTDAIATNFVSNEYSTNTGVNGDTDWTFTMPTRRYNVARAYSAGANESVGSTVFTNLTHDDAGLAIAANPVINPLLGAQTDRFQPSPAGNVVSNDVVGKRHQLCVTGIALAGGAKGGAEGTNRLSAVTADREETFMGLVGNQPVFSPSSPAVPTAFCGEATVLAFNAENLPSSLGAKVARRDIKTDNPDGWARISLNGIGGAGLPLLGSSYITYTNVAAQPGKVGTYGFAFPHRTNQR